MTDDERLALAIVKLADAVDLILNVLDLTLALPSNDTDKLVAARMLLSEARTAALGVDRGSMKDEAP